MSKKHRRMDRRKRKRTISIIARWSIVLVVIIALFIVFLLFGGSIFPALNVYKTVSWEAGSESTPVLSDFLKKETDAAQLLTDTSEIDCSVIGSYEIEIQIKNKTVVSTLNVEDTTAPSATANDLTSATDIELEASAFVSDIVDATEVTVSYETAPDFSIEGDQSVYLILTDEGGNETELTAILTLVTDTQAPVIEGVEDQTVYVGDTISYKSGVTVTDDYDTDVTLEIDNSEVDLETEGTYTVTYTATDFAGNSTSVTAQITVEEAPVGIENYDEMMELAQEVLDDITDGDWENMSKYDVAYAIYIWCNTKIAYTGSSDKTSWINEAINAFTTKAGDCFTYFSAAKALLTLADIDNIDVVKSDTSHSSHYWSLVDVGSGYYHFDTTPRKGDGDYFFLVTDAQLEEYSSSHNNSHIFDHSLYPATPEEIITEMS